MGIDLGLLVMSEPIKVEDNIPVSNRLNLKPDYRIFSQIEYELMTEECPELVRVVRPITVPKSTKIGVYGEEGINYTRFDCYDNELTYARASDLSKIVVPEDTKHWNKAVFELLKNLKPDHEIVLYWF